MTRSMLCVIVALSACKSDAASPKAQEKASGSAPHKLAGVYPSDFLCSSIATTDTLTELLGGPTRPLDSASSVATGTPQPCAYEVNKGTVQTDAGPMPSLQYWTFDFDCREGMKQRADKLFAQYRAQTGDRIQEYNGVTDAGAKPLADAAVGEMVKPGEAVEVAVGAKALDHNGQGILFIDDDAPCYVRVVGPDAGKRLELAKLVAKNLTFANAPMTPRAMP